jgi:glutaredoxin 3
VQKSDYFFIKTKMEQIKLYNIDGCGYCAMVREVLNQLELDHETIDVPWAHQDRTEVLKVSGQSMVPVLVHGKVILSDEYEIIDYLKKTYPVKP